MDISPETLQKLRSRLRFKLWRHVGAFCPDVDDLLQEVVVRFLRAEEEHRLRNPEVAGAFLNGICDNLISEYRRKLWREEPYEPAIAEQTQRVMPDADLLAVREAVAIALQGLAERDQALLKAFYLEDRDKEEICAEYGMTEGHLRVALFRAKERFRKIYQDKVKHRDGGRH
jgi:RNA polymerase sigma-70 factor (ECF subfamily)